MTLSIAILATITATVVLITKLIELQVANSKLKEIAANNPNIVTRPSHSTAERTRIAFRVASIFPFVFVGVITLCFAMDWVFTRIGLGVVVFCTIATPFFAIIPLLNRIIGIIERMNNVAERHVMITKTLVGVHDSSTNEQNEQGVRGNAG